jgi:hypothetical protein
MSKANFELNLPGLNQLMKGPEMQAILQEKGNEVASRAKSMCPKGEYETRTVTGRFIATTFVSAENWAAINDGFEHNTLNKALGGG